jgi:formylglycine-generating enzyme required for sulfatase activity
MNEDRKEIILKKTPMVRLSTGLASRGLQVARQLAQQSHRIITNSIGMKLVLIPNGTFMMGSPIDEEGRLEDEVQHQVTISQDYHLGVTEVTQGQYMKVMGNNPSNFQCHQSYKVQGDSSNHPVEMVSSEDAIEFCKRLSELPEEKHAGRVYRLPTEAEWEYACRAGSTSKYSFGDDEGQLCDYAWFSGNSNQKTNPVGQKKPNAWGLYDMHGNVLEWCADWYDDYPKQAVTDPVGPAEGVVPVDRVVREYSQDVLFQVVRHVTRVNRGGSCGSGAASSRSAYRNCNAPRVRSPDKGFRVALSFFGIPKSPEASKSSDMKIGS